VATATFDVDDLIDDAKYENVNNFTRTITGLISFSTEIAPNAFSGPANVYFNVFTDDPGVPYCIPASILIWIHKG